MLLVSLGMNLKLTIIADVSWIGTPNFFLTSLISWDDRRSGLRLHAKGFFQNISSDPWNNTDVLGPRGDLAHTPSRPFSIPSLVEVCMLKHPIFSAYGLAMFSL